MTSPSSDAPPSDPGSAAAAPAASASSAVPFVAPAEALWRGPRWALSLLLAGLATLGPFAIDTYLPAFTAIASSLSATPVQMQQTLSAYLLAFALMNLFHGALADSFGRRPVVLGGLVAFVAASVGCALAQSIGALVFWRAVQGLAAGAGMVVGRAIIRDLHAPAEAQRVMSQVTIFFGVAPAIAPVLGGLMVGPLGWRSIFWLLAAIALVLALANVRLLPETLEPAARQPFHPAPLLRGYGQLVRNPSFLALVVASGIPFNGMFLYVLSAPAWLGGVLGLAPTQFFWFFVASVGGIMAGAALSGRLAGRVAPRRQVRWGFVVVGVATLVNLALNAFVPPPAVWGAAWGAAWAIAPVALYSFGWSLLTPVVTLLVLEQAPQRRGMASSVHSSIGSGANAVVAGVLAPLVMHSAVGLAVASAGLMLTGLLAWTWVKRRVTV
ncbi:MAG: multidrug effflux MFS transporter [Rubrivivax sp.]|nr:multidrug effflux MFS transporter [Rubrivivax sp.]